jgi:hypothetical protein
MQTVDWTQEDADRMDRVASKLFDHPQQEEIPTFLETVDWT